MEVTFIRTEQGQCAWEAVRGKRTRVPAGPMGGLLRTGDLPHDLAQFIVERELGIEYGFWGLIAAGATFKSTGRKRTKPGRQVIAEHRTELMDAEQRANAAVTAWRAGVDSDVAAELSSVAQSWAALPTGGALVFDWRPITHRRA